MPQKQVLPTSIHTSKLKLSLVILLLNIIPALRAQKKAPLLFRIQERHTNRHIHRYLKTDTVIETSGAFIHLHVSKNNNNKPWLLLLHGMGVNAKTNWYKQIKPLSKHFNLVMPDLVYFGESRAKTDNYSAEFQAQQIHEAIKQLPVNEKLNVMGFSYGGLTAALYNQLFPADVLKLIIIDGPVKYYSAEMADSLANAVGLPGMANILVPQSAEEFKGTQKAVMSKKIRMSKRLTKKFISHYFTPGRDFRLKQLNYLTSQQKTYQNYSYNLNNTPTLLVWGSRDGVVPLSVGQQLHLNFPNTTRLLVFKKAKHDVHFRCSKPLNKAVINFLKN